MRIRNSGTVTRDKVSWIARYRTDDGGYRRKRHTTKEQAEAFLDSLPNMVKNIVSREDQFWRFVDKTGDCWEWQGARNQQGYGNVAWKGRTYLASKVAYMITYGEIPDGMVVCHKCDNPPCCNPDHLWLGTPSENTMDSVKKGRFRPKR